MPTDWFLEEYKAVQLKIDEVLKSQFQVRSWCVTLLTVAVFGILGTGRSPLWLIAALPIVAMFQLVDSRQRWFRKILAGRAMNLESGINLLGLPIEGFDAVKQKRWVRLRSYIPGLGAVPGVARLLAQENTRLGRIRRNAEVIFYCIQYLLISVILVVHVVTNWQSIHSDFHSFFYSAPRIAPPNP